MARPRVAISPENLGSGQADFADWRATLRPRVPSVAIFACAPRSSVLLMVRSAPRSSDFSWTHRSFLTGRAAVFRGRAVVENARSSRSRSSISRRGAERAPRPGSTHAVNSRPERRLRRHQSVAPGVATKGSCRSVVSGLAHGSSRMRCGPGYLAAPCGCFASGWLRLPWGSS